MIDPTRLYPALLNTRLQSKDNPLYQVIYDLIRILVQQQDIIDSFSSSSGSSGSQGIPGVPGLSDILNLMDSCDSDNQIIIPGIQGSQGIQGLPGIPGFIFDDSNSDNSTDLLISINYWQKSSLGIYYNDGNVGIGTSNPADKLDVIGSTSNSSAYAVKVSALSGSGLLNLRNDGVTESGPNALAAMEQLVSGDHSFIISDSGQINTLTALRIDPGEIRSNIVCSGTTGATTTLQFINTQGTTADGGLTYTFIATPNSTVIGSIVWRSSRNTGGGFNAGGIYIRSRTAEAWTNSAQGTIIEFGNIKIGSTSQYTALQSDSTNGLRANGATSDNTTYSFQAINSSNANLFAVRDDGNVGLGNASPTAYFHIKAGTATAGTAPSKFTSGTNLTSPETGAYEYNGNHYVTNGQSLRYPFGGTLFDHFADAGNGTTVETDLYSDTTIASTLFNNGDKIKAEYGGVFVSSATATREVRIYFSGTAIFDTGALTLSLSSAWTAFVTIIRVSSTTVRYMISFTTEGAALAAYTAVGQLAGLTLSSTNIIKITGQAAGVGAATNDIVAKMGTVSFQPAA